MDSYGNIYPLSNPFVVTTAAFTVAGWIIAFVGGCVAQLHGVSWWIIIFELCFIVGTIVALGLGGFGPHRGMLLTLLAISIVYLTYAIPIVYHNPDSGARATTGGFIIMIIMQFFWVFLLGMSEESKLYRWIYGHTSFSSMRPPMIQHNFTNVHPAGGQKESTLPAVGGTPAAGGATGASNRAAGAPPGTPRKDTSNNFETATALHSYQANPEDPNELSFSKDEVLEILDRKGNWWQARKQDGSVGIVPSNYFS